MNAVAQASRLLPEILAKIFSYNVAENVKWRKKKPGIGWISVTHVCRHWRQVALDHCRLWRHINLSLDEKLVEMFLVRSREAPLVISWIPGTVYNAPIKIAQLAYVEKLHLGKFDGRVEGLERLLGSPAPVLEVAEILCPPLICPADLFGGLAPRLRCLCLHQCSDFSSSWTSPIFSQLVSLKIEHTKGSSAPKPPRAEVFDALKSMVMLEELILNYCLPKCLQNSSTPEAFALASPFLQRLTLSGDFMDIVDLLRCTRIPDHGVLLDLTCTTPQSATVFREILPLLAEAGGNSPAPFSRMEVESQTERVFSLRAERSSDQTTPSISVRFEWGLVSEWTAIEVMRAVFKTLPVEHLHSLDIDIEELSAMTWWGDRHRFDRALWLDMLGSANELTKIAVWGTAVHSFCPVLRLTTRDGHHWQSSPETTSPGGQMTFFLPRLKSLSLFQMDFAHFYPDEGLRLRKLLPLLLQERNATIPPLVELELGACCHRMADELDLLVKSLVLCDNSYSEDEDSAASEEDEDDEDEDEDEDGDEDDGDWEGDDGMDES
ncbi:hypothetical protein BV25DRAFT_1992144 [Artomyces pyxidatus]|uniref:Uncharacterized protein n=1 Tax=Artomyces pyxidatus TaxID=48021 RepID=A0ACB8SY95_9AGAM|nr:hypothetical protein BV25DRAFT_1992144 [Artomyces pyxidatus]